MKRPTILKDISEKDIQNDRIARGMIELLNPDMKTLRKIQENKKTDFVNPILNPSQIDMDIYVDNVNGIQSVKNVVDEFIDNTRNKTQGFHEYTRADVTAAKIKTFYTGLPYSINNMYLVPGNIMEFTLYIIITMIANKIKKTQLPIKEQKSLETLLTSCEEFMRNRSLGFITSNAESKYIILKQEIIFNYLLTMI